MKTTRFTACLLLGLLPAVLDAGDRPPANSELALEESFERRALGEGWNVTTGSWTIRDGVLRAAEVESDQHSAAARRALVTSNAVYQLRFRFVDDGKSFHFGFDPVRGELQKRGHLFSVIVTNDSWRILKHVDKDRPKDDPNETLADAKTEFRKDQWYSLRVTTWESHVTAAIEGKEPLRASHDSFSVSKPTLVFRCLGDGVEIDDIKVWKQVR